MTIADQITRLTNAKAAIKQSIENKGVDVSDTALLDEYPALIDKIEGGGEGGADPYYENFYNLRTKNGTNMVSLFAYCTGDLDLSSIDVSKVTNMERMFSNCSSNVNIDGWDTSKVSNMNYMFYYFTGSIDLSKLDFSSVTNASNMFSSANTDKINLTGLSFPKTTSLTYIFYQAKGTTLDLSSWDITNITDLSSFLGFAGYKTIDLTGWKTTKVTSMNSIFYYLSSLEKLIMPDWDMTNTTKTTSFFYNCSKLNYIDLSRSNDATIAKIATLVPAKTLATYGQILIPVDSSQANIEALVAKYWKPVGPRIDMTSCEIATELDEVKPGESTKLCYGNSEPWYGNDVNVEYVSSDETIATIDKETMMVTSTGIEGTTEITARDIETQEIISVAPITLSVSETDNYPNVIKFRGTSTPTSYNYIKVNGKDVKLSSMNYNSASGIYTYDVGAPITSIQFNGYNGSNYTNTCTDVIKIDTSNVTNMNYMFNSCNNLTSIDLSSFDTSNVTSMIYMFNSCENLTSITFGSSFNTSNVTNMGNMLSYCANLTSITFGSSFNTNKVTNMSNMFYNCSNLTSITFGSSFDTSNVTSMGTMFANCESLTSLDLSNFDMSKTTNTNSMFSGCNKLHTLRLDNCSNDTINKIITSSNFPTNAITGVTRKIYCKKAGAAGLTAPKNWVFEFVD